MYKYRGTIIYISLLAAFLAGILFMNLAGDTYLGKSMLSLPAMMENNEDVKLQQAGYLYYLLKVRGGAYLLLGALGQVIGGAVWMILYGAWFCITEGMLLTSGFVQQKISGVWLLILVQIPHMIVYAFVYALLLKSYFGFGRTEGERRKVGERRKIFVQSWLANFPVMLVGILAEYYVNPWCMNKIFSLIK